MTISITPASDIQLLEFYLCGMRTNYDSAKQAKKYHASTQQVITNCDYCDSYHVVPQHSNREEMLEKAKGEYAKLIESLYGEPASNSSEKANVVFEEATPTDLIIIRGYN